MKKMKFYFLSSWDEKFGSVVVSRLTKEEEMKLQENYRLLPVSYPEKGFALLRSDEIEDWTFKEFLELKKKFEKN